MSHCPAFQAGSAIFAAAADSIRLLMNIQAFYLLRRYWQVSILAVRALKSLLLCCDLS
jgi:hypothetical protein